MNDEEHTDGVVIPLRPGAELLPQQDPWRLLAQGNGLLVTWTKAPERGLDTWGTALRGTSALSTQLGTILSRAGSPAVAAGANLVRVELPTGSTLRDLVPAVGGGLRGLVRDSKGIAGHARLVPVAGGTAAGIALGPLIGLLAISVGTEMLARHQQEQKLARLEAGLTALRRVDDETMDAQLVSAEEALTLGSAALVDRVSIPTSIGLGPAIADLRVIKQRGLRWLKTWESAAETLPTEGGVGVDRMRAALAGDSPQEEYRQFPERIARLYQALALDSRALVVAGAEAALHNPDESFEHLKDRLSAGLRANAEVQERMRRLLWKLAAPPVTYSYPWQGSDAIKLDRDLATMAANAADLPDALGVVTPENRQVLEVLRRPDGTMHVLAPPKAS